MTPAPCAKCRPGVGTETRGLRALVVPPGAPGCVAAPVLEKGMERFIPHIYTYIVPICPKNMLVYYMMILIYISYDDIMVFRIHPTNDTNMCSSPYSLVPVWRSPTLNGGSYPHSPPQDENIAPGARSVKQLQPGAKTKSSDVSFQVPAR